MSERTKGKWEVIRRTEIFSGSNLITDLLDYVDDIKESEANAEFICKAVNSHDLLVEASEAGLKELNFYHNLTVPKHENNPSKMCDGCNTIIKLEQALAAAKGEKG